MSNDDRWHKDWSGGPAQGPAKKYDFYFSTHQDHKGTEWETVQTTYLETLGTVCNPFYLKGALTPHQALLASRRVVVTEIRGFINAAQAQDIADAQANEIPASVLRGGAGEEFRLEDITKVELVLGGYPAIPGGDKNYFYAHVVTTVVMDWGRLIGELTERNLEARYVPTPPDDLEQVFSQKLKEGNQILTDAQFTDDVGGASLREAIAYIKQLPPVTINAILAALEDVTPEEWESFRSYLTSMTAAQAFHEEQCPHCGTTVRVFLDQTIGQCPKCGGNVAFAIRAVFFIAGSRHVPLDKPLAKEDIGAYIRWLQESDTPRRHYALPERIIHRQDLKLVDH